MRNGCKVCRQTSLASRRRQAPTVSPSARVHPVELMYKKIGFFPSVYCKYSSSATMSSVTAGTSCEIDSQERVTGINKRQTEQATSKTTAYLNKADSRSVPASPGRRCGCRAAGSAGPEEASSACALRPCGRSKRQRSLSAHLNIAYGGSASRLRPLEAV